MVDFQTQFKHYGYKYNAPERPQPEANLRDLNRENNALVFKSERVQVHDCREDVMQDYTDKHLWEASIFAKGVTKTYESAKSLHRKETKEVNGKRVRDKLLFDVGKKGAGKGDLNFPRGMTCTIDGNILVADTKNHRIQRFNECGVYISHFSEKGSNPGQLDEPTSVAVMENGRVAVADRRNKRVQVFSEGGRFKFELSTRDEPFYIACDGENNIVVSTIKRTVEVYRRASATLWYSFSLGPPNEKFCPCPIAVNDKHEVVVCDRANNKIRFHKFSGEKLYEFAPTSASDGLAVDPSALCLNPLGQVMVADSLNHTVNLYTERGKLIEQVIGPTDDAGAVQAIAVGPQGHLVATEFSTNGAHCLKVFRYRNCECHSSRPGSSKRTSKKD